MKFIYVISISVLTFLSFSSEAQRLSKKKSSQSLKIRHVQGIKSFELGGGISGYNGVYGSIYFSEFFANNWYWKGGVGYEYKDLQNDTKYSSIYGDLLLGRTFLDQGSLFVNGLAGATVAYDQLAGLQTDKKPNGFVYGPVIGLEFELYINNNVMFLISGTNRFIIPKEFGDRWYLGAALRFKL